LLRIAARKAASRAAIVTGASLVDVAADMLAEAFMERFPLKISDKTSDCATV
jgi:hypothetical protein